MTIIFLFSPVSNFYAISKIWISKPRKDWISEHSNTGWAWLSLSPHLTIDRKGGAWLSGIEFKLKIWLGD